ncbi:cryptochrome/photolyase family protein [Salisediminibacterium selenitireducens]|uniref:Deoxyribodipyrimidine photo-lyase n=1 Tax=Bacillus selenitireducens (strain ATCC 700615 / DSM 15326 / MLS10) TaxID=439292 RepID=D6XYK2_BACIE|nr:deoxyribodipyrimidine photo-lyase [Salisediminibacterium selenitireducens]ADI00271.1 Deoxyribodipyrimidine photo-lyase [[Bacillus] selenitireducens MLS10]
MHDPLTVVWFRNDLRLNDHPAIDEALTFAEDHDTKILCVFHIHDDLFSHLHTRHDYFFQTLRHFSDDLKSRNIAIRFLYGEVTEAFASLLKEYSGVQAVFASKDYTSFATERDRTVRTLFEERNIRFTLTVSNHLQEPSSIMKDDGTPYKVYTPYSKQWLKKPVRGLLAGHEKKLRERTCEVAMNRGKLDDFLASSDRTWQALGEDHAHERLEQFVTDRLTHYGESRDFPAVAGTSRLSPYLKTGVLSVAQVYHAAYPLFEKGDDAAVTFIKELAWRDFYTMIHYHFENLRNQEFQEKYRTLSWNEDDELLEYWKQGQTGFPLIDAAMRQLNTTGWMHNRLRMATASFLTKDYRIDWREGERYFAEKLIDYDEASNTGGWQWAASVGTDAVPYFRVFNPVRQSKRFDPEGTFIRQYVPELKDVPASSIHEPAKLSEAKQKEYRVRIGTDYPLPTVDHSEARKAAITMFEGGTNQ